MPSTPAFASFPLVPGRPPCRGFSVDRVAGDGDEAADGEVGIAGGEGAVAGVDEGDGDGAADGGD